MSENPAPAASNVDDDEGLIANALRKVFGRSWRTGLAAAGSLVGSVVVVVSQSWAEAPHWLVVAGSVLTGLSTTLGLGAAKDARVSGLPAVK